MIFDLIVIGGGSGGIAAARRAAQLHNKKVALVEGKSVLGGTCVNVGCIPKKIMYNAAEIAESIRSSAAYGFGDGDGDGVDVGKTPTTSAPTTSTPITPTTTFNVATLIKGRDAFIAKLNTIYKDMMDRNEIQVFQGMGHLVEESVSAESETGDAENFLKKEGRAVMISNPNDDYSYCGADDISNTKNSNNKNTVIRGRNILIATGGRPLKDVKVEGYELGIDSDQFFHQNMSTLPRIVGIVGGGYIGLEFASLLKCLGVERVICFMRGFLPLRGKDSMIREEVFAGMKDIGVEFICSSFLKKISRNNDCSNDYSIDGGSESLTITYVTGTESTEKMVTVDKLIWAIGRSPMTTGMGLREGGGIELDEDGYIKTDDNNETSAKGVWAVGDCTSSLAHLTPVAIASSRRLVDRLFSGAKTPSISKMLIPTVIFTHPLPVATIGYTEEEASAKWGSSIKTYESCFNNLFDCLKQKKQKNRMKMVCSSPNGVVVGLHLVGRGVDEMIQGFAVAMEMGATKADFDRTIAVHPCGAEELVTM